MGTLSLESKQKLNKIKDFLNKFFHSDGYIWLLVALVFIGWFFEVWVPFFIVTLLLTTVIFFVCQNTTPIFPFMWFFLSGISIGGEDLGKYAWAIAFFGPFVLSIFYNIFRYKPDFKHVLSPKNFRMSTLSYLLLPIPFLLGGIANPDRNWGFAGIFLLLMAVLGFAYIYFLASAKKRTDEENNKLPKYLMKVMFAYGILVTLQILTESIRTGSYDAFLFMVQNKTLHLGWATPNPAASALALAIPANFYFMLKKNKFAFIYLFIAILEYVAILITGSRGALLFAAIALPFLIIYTLIKTENRKQLLIIGGVFLAFLITFILVYFSKIKELLSVMIAKGFDDSARFEIYKHGWEVFKSYPIFGAGWDYGIGHASVSFSPYLFHSTLFQILGCLGVLGMLVFLYFYWARYSAFFQGSRTPEKAMIFAAMLIFEGYAMIDPILFIPPTFFIMLATLAFAADITAPENIRQSKLILKLYDRRKNKRKE